MPERSFVYLDECGMRRTLTYDVDDPSRFTVKSEATFERLAELNRHSGEFERATDRFTIIARVPFTVWETAQHEGWDDERWARFLNDPDNRDYRVWHGRV